MPSTTSDVHSSFNVEDRQNYYSLLLTCNNLPWMLVK